MTLPSGDFPIGDDFSRHVVGKIQIPDPQARRQRFLGRQVIFFGDSAANFAISDDLCSSLL